MENTPFILKRKESTFCPYPDIRFSLINNGKNVFTTSGRGSIFDGIVSIYGREIGSDLVPVDSNMNGNSIRGFVSGPGMSLPSRSRQIFCVNGRMTAGDYIAFISYNAMLAFPMMRIGRNISGPK